MPKLLLGLREVIIRTACRGRRILAVLAAGMTVLPLAVVLGGCGAPPGPKTLAVAARTTANEPAPLLADPGRAMLAARARPPQRRHPRSLFSPQLIPASTATTGGRTDACASRYL
jgi:hypothetical protein